MNMQAPVAVPSAAPSRPYPGLVTAWLWLDLALCAFMGLMGLATTLHLLQGTFGPEAPFRAIYEMVIEYGIAVFGITGNVLLLRHRRSGFWFACIALAFVAAGIVAALLELPGVIGDLETLDDKVILGGFIVTWCARWLLNLGYAFVLRRAWRCLQPATTGAHP